MHKQSIPTHTGIAPPRVRQVDEQPATQRVNGIIADGGTKTDG
jgi:hypothetical protein